MYKEITEEMFIDDILEVGDFDNVDIIKVMYRYMVSEFDVTHYNPEQISKKFVVLSREELLHSIYFNKELKQYAKEQNVDIDKMEVEKLFNLFAEITSWNLVERVDEFSFLLDKEYYGRHSY
jgi:hypothetical protein